MRIGMRSGTKQVTIMHLEIPPTRQFIYKSPNFLETT